MKRMKKIVSILLAAIMVLGMSLTAFATETGSDTPAKVKHTYEILQIFTGQYYNGVLSNIYWGKNGTGTEGQKVDEDTLKDLTAVTDNTSDTEQLAIIQKYVNLKSEVYMTGEQDQTKFELPDGYYLVRDKAESLDGTNVPYTLYVTKVVNGTLNITPKGNIPEPDKKIVEGTEKVETNEASIGDVVSYEITGSMPSNIDDYNTYYYMFTDTLSKGLTYNEEPGIKVEVKNGETATDVTKYFYKNVSERDATTGTTIEVGILDIKALTATKKLECKDPENHSDEKHEDGCYVTISPIVSAITADTKVIVTYTATLNKDAEIAGDGNPNDVKLSYSNDPNNSGDGAITPPPEEPNKPNPTHPKGESPKKVVVTYTTELTIKKTNEDGQFLPGVEFTLTGNGVNVVLITEESYEVAEDGEYWKLKNGTYTITAPTKAEDETDNTADYDSTETKYKKGEKNIVETAGVADENGVKAVVGTVGADGTVTFTGLGAGDYTLEETKTLHGYNTVDPISFTISFDAATKAFSSDKIELDETEEGESTNTFVTAIVNRSGSLLPSTGGIGTTIFYVVGGILVIGAGILLVAKKRMSKR